MVDIRRDAKAFKLECVKHNVAIGRAVPGAAELRAHLGRHDAGDAEGGSGVPHGARVERVDVAAALRSSRALLEDDSSV